MPRGIGSCEVGVLMDGRDRLYWYRALVVGVVDGDTIDISIDLGLRVSIMTRVRLHGINAPEMHGASLEAAKRSTKYLVDTILAKQILVNTIKDRGDKYGRLLAKVWLDDRFINREMIEHGFAVEYLGDPMP